MPFLAAFLDGKFTYFCIMGSLVVSLDGKINYFKMLYNKFFSIKHINE